MRNSYSRLPSYKAVDGTWYILPGSDGAIKRDGKVSFASLEGRYTEFCERRGEIKPPFSQAFYAEKFGGLR